VVGKELLAGLPEFGPGLQVGFVIRKLLMKSKTRQKGLLESDSQW
jgi:hypothetical protein